MRPRVLRAAPGVLEKENREAAGDTHMQADSESHGWDDARSRQKLPEDPDPLGNIWKSLQSALCGAKVPEMQSKGLNESFFKPTRYHYSRRDSKSEVRDAFNADPCCCKILFLALPLELPAARPWMKTVLNGVDNIFCSCPWHFGGHLSRHGK